MPTSTSLGTPEPRSEAVQAHWRSERASRFASSGRCRIPGDYRQRRPTPKVDRQGAGSSPYALISEALGDGVLISAYLRSRAWDRRAKPCASANVYGPPLEIRTARPASSRSSAAGFSTDKGPDRVRRRHADARLCVHVSDVADAGTRAITVPLPEPKRHRRSRVLNIGTGVAMSVLELASVTLRK